ncbi:hypothetical protein [Ruficoccus sp. ZRK36]|uniref:hypothetical protein n=1 Tax=Ruficoccus sp. ZRK36 TaxID=2866311 RepID=UPI001C7315AA|nr:hypothetical protein [Ruficoccus sp. ZRK36]QYY35293.1 hypothetical protein K0V07_13450 [Ruficoccus sp. ZRK36]
MIDENTPSPSPAPAPEDLTTLGQNFPQLADIDRKAVAGYNVAWPVNNPHRKGISSYQFYRFAYGFLCAEVHRCHKDERAEGQKAECRRSLTRPDITAAVSQLRRSERGQRALSNFKALILDGGLGLDHENTRALVTLARALQTGNGSFILDTINTPNPAKE